MICASNALAFIHESFTTPPARSCCSRFRRTRLEPYPRPPGRHILSWITTDPHHNGVHRPSTRAYRSHSFTLFIALSSTSLQLVRRARLLYHSFVPARSSPFSPPQTRSKPHWARCGYYRGGFWLFIDQPTPRSLGTLAPHSDATQGRARLAFAVHLCVPQPASQIRRIVLFLFRLPVALDLEYVVTHPHPPRPPQPPDLPVTLPTNPPTITYIYIKCMQMQVSRCLLEGRHRVAYAKLRTRARVRRTGFHIDYGFALEATVLQIDLVSEVVGSLVGH